MARGSLAAAAAELRASLGVPEKPRDASTLSALESRVAPPFRASVVEELDLSPAFTEPGVGLKGSAG